MWNKQRIIFFKKDQTWTRSFIQNKITKITAMEEVQDDLLNKRKKKKPPKNSRTTSNMSKRILRIQARSMKKYSARRMPITLL